MENSWINLIYLPQTPRKQELLEMSTTKGNGPQSMWGWNLVPTLKQKWSCPRLWDVLLAGNTHWWLVLFPCSHETKILHENNQLWSCFKNLPLLMSSLMPPQTNPSCNLFSCSAPRKPSGFLKVFTLHCNKNLLGLNDNCNKLNCLAKWTAESISFSISHLNIYESGF